MKLKNETLRAFYARTARSQSRKTLRYRDPWRERELNPLDTKIVLTVSEVRDLDHLTHACILLISTQNPVSCPGVTASGRAFRRFTPRIANLKHRY